MKSEETRRKGKTEKYEWMAMSEWLRYHYKTGRSFEDDGWELVGGALRRKLPDQEDKP